MNQPSRNLSQYDQLANYQELAKLSKNGRIAEKELSHQFNSYLVG